MIKLIQTPTSIEATGNIPKRINEYFGRVNSGTEKISIARMNSPSGWEEPGQSPDFDEYTIVITGTLKVETRKDVFFVYAGSLRSPVCGYMPARFFTRVGEQGLIFQKD